MSSIYSCCQYVLTTIKSRQIRKHLANNGLEYVVKKYPIVGGKTLLSPEEAHKTIASLLSSDDPVMIGRFGSVELSNVAKMITGFDYKKELSINTLCNNAGFFPNDEDLVMKFAQLMVESMKFCDLQGVWYLPYEDYFTRHYLPENCKVTEVRYLEPWFSKHPWTSALEGKKVLVVHPFAESITKQYRNREHIFDEKDGYLPDFDLSVIKAVQTIAGTKDNRFNNWFEALDYMFEEIERIDYDIAILGCGAYGYPLAARIKRAGKKAIHLGGVTQILFGIKGKRWEEDKNPIVRELFNEYWIRPDQSEIPQNKSNVENGCYW